MLLEKCSKIKQLPRFLKNKYINAILNVTNDRRLRKLIKSSCKYYFQNKKKLKILFAPGFNINKTFIFHDVIILSLLHSNGADIFFTSGRNRFKSAYSFYGGVWTTGCDKSDQESLKHSENIQKRYMNNFASVCNIEKYISEAEVKDIMIELKQLSIDEMLQYSYKNVLLGHAAMNTVRNLHMVSRLELLENGEDELRKSLCDCIIYAKWFSRAIEDVRPDRIVSHESFYFPWFIMQEIAKLNKIPFYNYYFGLRPLTFIWAKNRSAMNVVMDDIWNKYKDKPLTTNQLSKVDKLFEERKVGKIFHKQQVWDINDIEKKKIIEFAKAKPTAVIYANMIWDMAALDKEICFAYVKDSYIQLVNYFKGHPEFQLIIKSHPDEEHPNMPRTVEQIKVIISREIGKLPENVIYIPPKAPISVYDLLPFTKCSIVHTSTLGMESPIFGVPAITLSKAHYRGKGFTDDPNSEGEVYSYIFHRLSDDIDSQDMKIRSELAKRYFYCYLYNVFQDLGIRLHWRERPEIEKSYVHEYLKNKKLSAILDTIIKGGELPVF